MAEMTIRLRCDPVTGKKDILISLHSDADVLAHEHEQMHRALVEKLIGKGLIQASELGQVVVEREADRAGSTQAAQAETPSPTALAEGQ